MIQLSIGHFEGPLDLLLALVRKEEMDIMDIDIHKITSQYLDVIQNSPALNLNEGGEFIRMASQLMLMKSRSLIPESLMDEEMDENEPALSKEDLARALAQHSLLKKAGERLNERALLERDIWSCAGLSFAPKERAFEEGELSSLMLAFKRVIHCMNIFKMKVSWPSTGQWIQKLRGHFTAGRVFLFSSMMDKKNPRPLFEQMLLSFLAVLELSKRGLILLSQKGGDIEITSKKTLSPDHYQYSFAKTKKAV